LATPRDDCHFIDGPSSSPAQPRPPSQDLDAQVRTPRPAARKHVDLDHPPVPSRSARLRTVAPLRAGELRIGLIGTGGMAAAHAENFAKHDKVRVAACLDIVPASAQTFAKRFAIPHIATDIEDLIEHCDAVAVVTPDASHAEYVIRALRCNRHVLCEKPLTSTLADARLVAREAREATKRGVIGMVNFSYRCAAAMHHAAWMHGQGAVGEVRHISAQYMQGWLAETHEPGPGALWRLRTATGGGVLADLGCHLLDFVTGIVGEVSQIHCLTGNFPKVAADGKPFTKWKDAVLDADDTAVVNVRFAKGGLGVLQVSRWASGRHNTIHVDLHGTRGALVIDLDSSYDQVHHHDVASKAWRTERPAPAPSTWQRFIGAIRSGKQDQPDLVRGAQIQAYLEACRKSLVSGRWEDIPAWE
jgi:predicted dehydrogenase